MTEWYRPSARHVATLLAEHIIDLCDELLRQGQRRDEMWCVGNIAVNGGVKWDRRGGVKKDHLAAAGLSP